MDILEKSNVVIKKINMEHSKQVLDLIKQHYIGNTIPYKMLKYELEEETKLHVSRALDFLSCGLSVGVFEKSTNRLVAVALNVIEEVDTPFAQTTKKFLDPNLQMYIRFLKAAKKDVLQILEVKKVLNFRLATAIPEFRSKHLQEPFLLAILKIAQTLDCKYVTCVATTSFYHKMPGMRILKEIDYSGYVDELTGTRPFKDLVIKPHTHARVLAYTHTDSPKL